MVFYTSSSIPPTLPERTSIHRHHQVWHKPWTFSQSKKGSRMAPFHRTLCTSITWICDDMCMDCIGYTQPPPHKKKKKFHCLHVFWVHLLIPFGRFKFIHITILITHGIHNPGPLRGTKFPSKEQNHNWPQKNQGDSCLMESGYIGQLTLETKSFAI